MNGAPNPDATIVFKDGLEYVIHDKPLMGIRQSSFGTAPKSLA
jgi:hypothetical protein